jgi:hypothetical protein
MAKRFTDSEKWKDPFFEELTKDLKLAWLYILDDCCHAGIWQKSIKRLNFAIDSNLTERDLLEAFSKRILILAEDKWFIQKFITFQYGKDFMNSKQKPVLSAIKILNEHRLIEELPNGSLTLSIPYDKGYDTPMDKELVMDMVKVQDKSMVMVKDKVEYKDLITGEYKEKDLSKEFDNFKI